MALGWSRPRVLAVELTYRLSALYKRWQSKERCCPLAPEIVRSTWKIAFACVALAVVPTVFAATVDSDKAALLEFKANLRQTGGLLDTWTAASDPCGSGWAGVSCDCNAVVPFSSCKAQSSSQRVLQLDVVGSSRLTPQGPPAKLEGTISPVLGQMTELRLLVMPNNKLTGTLPSTLNQLTQLEYVDLSNNLLSGGLPLWAGALERGASVRLNDNDFTGPLPAAWCPRSRPTYDVLLSDNKGLCSTILDCMKPRIPSVSGTSFITPSTAVGSTGRLCDNSQSICDFQGCGILLGKYNTNLTRIYFAFAAFTPENNTLDYSRVEYFWALGTRPFDDDVLPTFPVDKLDNFTGIVPTRGNTEYSALLYPVLQQLRGVAFINRLNYYVTVTATSMDDPSLTANVTSNAIKTDIDPPFLPPDSSVDNTGGYSSKQTTTVTDSIVGSWDDFEDPESGVLFYQFQVREVINDPAVQGAPSQFRNITKLIYTGNATMGIVRGLELEVGHQYVILVNATNGALLSASEQSPPLLIVAVGESVTSSSAAIIAAAVIGICGVIVALITVYIVRSRYNVRRRTRHQQRRQMRELKGLMYGLVSSDTGGDPLQKCMDRIIDSRQLCFVTTDLEASTAQASIDHRAFLQVQDVHDTVMREGIAKHSGYEIITEGDAFQVAFVTVHQAVLFCQETQYRLLESVWPREVLKLPSCNEVLDDEKRPLFRGPRVRMGIHWAQEGSFTNRLHTMTKHRVFSGPGFQLAQKIGDIPSGGQVVMTHETWLKLSKDMDQAGFPTVENLGQYKLEDWPAPLWLYQVTHLLGKPLLRRFEALRRAEQVMPARGLDIVPPPQPSQSYDTLTFCAVRCALDELNLQLADADDDDAILELPPVVSRMLWEAIAINAMQFEGYIFKAVDPQGSYMIAFSSTLNAVRCAHAIQASLMSTQWPTESVSFSGATEQMPDGRPIFRGPRMATAIHETVEYSVIDPDGALSTLSQVSASTNLARPVSFGGGGEAFTRQVASVAFGGQVVLTESAWMTVQDHIPGQAQVVSLGVHVINVDGDASRVLLMEVMPSTLARRAFPPPKTTLKLEPGYRDSPDPNHHLALLYLKTSKPKEVATVEDSADTLADDLVSDTLTDYNLSLMMIGRCVRALLPVYDGYECKEPEMGKFTLAFRSLEAAVRWAAALQEDLLDLPWPDAVLGWSSSNEVAGVEGRPMWRGLRVGIGIAWGGATYRKPLNTGRADYFGNLPNLAARLSSMAAPGQIIVDGHGLGIDDTDVTFSNNTDSVIILPPLSGVSAAVLADISGGDSQRGIFSFAAPSKPPLPPPTVGTLAPPLVSQRRSANDDASSGSNGGGGDSRRGGRGGSGGGGGGGFGGEGTVQLSCLGHFRIKGIEKPQLIWQALPKRLAGREFPTPPNRVSDRSGFLAEIGGRSSSRRGPRGGSSFNAVCTASTGSTDGGSRFFPMGQKCRRFTMGSLFPSFNRGGNSGTSVQSPPTAHANSSSSSLADWHSTRANSRLGSMSMRQDSLPSRRSSENAVELGCLGGQPPPCSLSGQPLPTVRQSSGTIEPGVWWTDAQAAGVGGQELGDPGMDDSFTTASQGRTPSRLVHSGSHTDSTPEGRSGSAPVLTPSITSFSITSSTKTKRRCPGEGATSSAPAVSSRSPDADTLPTGSTSPGHPPIRWNGPSEPRPHRKAKGSRSHNDPEGSRSNPVDQSSPTHPGAASPVISSPGSAEVTESNPMRASPFAREEQQRPRKRGKGLSIPKRDGPSRSPYRATVDFATSPTVIPDRLPRTEPRASALVTPRRNSSPTAGFLWTPSSAASTTAPPLTRTLSDTMPSLGVGSRAFDDHVDRLRGGRGGGRSTSGRFSTDISTEFPSVSTLSDFAVAGRDVSGTGEQSGMGGEGPSGRASTPPSSTTSRRDSRMHLNRSPSMGRHAREVAETFVSQIRSRGSSRDTSRSSRRPSIQSRGMPQEAAPQRTDSGHLSPEELAALREQSSTSYFPSTGKRAAFRRATQS